MYRLFLYRNSYAMIVHALLEEIGVDHELRWAKIFTDEADPEFEAVSPLKRVPALDGPDGAVFETGAIALYLAERHPEADLLIPVGDPRRGRFLQWIHYLAAALQPEVNIQYHPEVYFDDPGEQERLREASRRRLPAILQVIEDGLSEGPYFFGETRTVCDYILAMQSIWPPVFPGTIQDWPAIERLTSTITSRPAVQRVLQLHGQA